LALVDLICALRPETDAAAAATQSFAQLRDRLLDIAPLDLSLIRRINAAEAEYWKGSASSRYADSTEVLGFDCGGEQHVFEVCNSFYLAPFPSAAPRY